MSMTTFTRFVVHSTLHPPHAKTHRGSLRESIRHLRYRWLKKIGRTRECTSHVSGVSVPRTDHSSHPNAEGRASDKDARSR